MQAGAFPAWGQAPARAAFRLDALIAASSLTQPAGLPDAPGFNVGAGAPAAEPTSAPAQTASAASQSLPASDQAILTGTVTSVQGTAIPNVNVSLLGGGSDSVRVVKADSEGRFTFSDLNPGTYHLVISAEGIQTYQSPDVVLAAGEQHAMPPAQLEITSATSSVQVTARPDAVATAQVQLQEKQRVLGILPNFYTSYIWNAAPLTPRLKFRLAIRSLDDPLAFLIAGGVAGVEQWHNTFPGYGRGPGGYAKRYGAAYGDTAIGRMVGSAILPSLLHQDPRYFYRGTGGVVRRTAYAIKSTFIVRGDNGKPEFNYSQLLGDLADSSLANLYRTPQDRTVALTFRNTGIIIGSNAAGNILREFLLHHLTPKMPSIDTGKAGASSGP